MRKVLLNVAVTLDGFIEGPNGQIDWCFVDQDYGMAAFMKRIDAIFFGRKSYELVLQMDPHPYPRYAKYVFSRTLREAGEGTHIINGDLDKAVEAILKENGKDIWLFGGAKLVTECMNHDLVDELHLSVHPLLLGGGTPLFQNINQRKAYRLIRAKEYSSGLVQLIYEKENRADGPANARG